MPTALPDAMNFGEKGCLSSYKFHWQNSNHLHCEQALWPQYKKQQLKPLSVVMCFKTTSDSKHVDGFIQLPCCKWHRMNTPMSPNSDLVLHVCMPKWFGTQNDWFRLNRYQCRLTSLAEHILLPHSCTGVTYHTDPPLLMHSKVSAYRQDRPYLQCSV